ncbi:MAG TPA: lipopolysaccharide heptosyltransferase II [Candidatus Eisenbacteria bacterium]
MTARGPGPLLVRLPNWLGDLILALPVIGAAAESDAVFLGPAPFEALVAPRFPRSRYVPWSRARRYGPLGALRSLRPRRALLLTESFSSALLAALAGIPERIGYAAEGRGFLLTRRVRRAGAARSRSRADEYREVALAAGLRVDPVAPSIAATAAETAAAAERLRTAGIGGAPYAVLAPGAAYGPAKQWGAERFAAAGAHLARHRGLALAVVGSAADRPVADQVAARAISEGARAVSLAGATDLPELFGLLDGARAVLSNDSGVMHAAAALGRPTVALFGSTSPVWTSADSPWVANLYAAYPCSPCYRRTCPIGYGCLRALDVRSATGALDRLLAPR